jgi:hypothetical protein
MFIMAVCLGAPSAGPAINPRDGGRRDQVKA